MSKKSTNRILVTGATGQIGSELTIELRKKYGKENVIAAGHKREPSETLLRSGPYLAIDTSNKKQLTDVVNEI